MKPEWKTVKLGDICDFERGLTYSKSDEADAPGITVLRANNVDLDSGQLNLDDLRYISANVTVDEKKYLSDNSILVCTASGSRDHLGKTAHISKPPRMTFGGFMGLLRPSSEIDSRYLFYLTRSDLYRTFISNLSSGTNINNLKGSDLLSWEIPLPPLAEQKRIVALLDEAFAGIDNAISMLESQSASVKQLLESHLGGIFSTRQHGWDMRKLKDCSTIIMGQSPEGSTYNAKAIGTPLINGPVEFSADAFGETVKEKWTTEPTKLCKKGDLILCVRGSTTGRMNIAGFDACIGRGVAAIRAKQSQSWVNHFINASRNKILGMGKGATFPNVSAADIGQMELTIPPENIQELLSQKFDDLRLLNADMCRSIERRVSLLKMLKSSFLVQAFAGDLAA